TPLRGHQNDLIPTGNGLRPISAQPVGEVENAETGYRDTLYSRREPGIRERPARRHNDYQHGTAASQHARRAAPDPDDLWRNSHQGRSRHRLPAYGYRKDGRS